MSDPSNTTERLRCLAMRVSCCLTHGAKGLGPGQLESLDHVSRALVCPWVSCALCVLKVCLVSISMSNQKNTINNTIKRIVKSPLESFNWKSNLRKKKDVLESPAVSYLLCVFNQHVIPNYSEKNMCFTFWKKSSLPIWGNGLNSLQLTLLSYAKEAAQHWVLIPETKPKPQAGV